MLVFAATKRFDPITGEEIVEKARGDGDVADKTFEEKENIEKEAVIEDEAKNLKQNPEPDKNAIRCIQPPGGSSTFTLG